MPLSPGSRLGPYTIDAPLGAGGMGEVYRARDERLGRDVAIKVLPSHLYESPESGARFNREARVLSQLNHPNICTLYDLGHEGNIHFLVMELIEGETLADRLARGPLLVGELLAAAGQMIDALAEAHRSGLVHRDLKPGNMMIAGSHVKLLDFGLARPVLPRLDEEVTSESPTLERPLTIAGSILGTVQYMAPEQFQGEEADERSDLFALGCVLYEMATGRHPFPGNHVGSVLKAMLAGKPEPISRVNESMPVGLERIVERCLAVDPDRRYPTAVEVGDDLARLRCWAREEGVPELSRICERIHVLEEGRDSWSAFELAREIGKLAPGDPMLERLRPDFEYPVSITTTPPGAKAYIRFYGDSEGEEIPIGVTPLEAIPFPRGLTRLRLELAGRRTVHDLVWILDKSLMNASDTETGTWHYTLRDPADLPAEMEEVPGGGFPLYMPGLDHLETEPTAAFLMDRHPVTNRDFRRFVDDGGYARHDHWSESFLDGNRELDFEEARARFVDAVGQPGPAGWELGEYPPGEDDHPVTGISWYEAAAYAAWAGKTLPTIFHWNRVAFTFSSALIAPLANLSGRGTVPVGQTRSVNRFGVHDLAGNVREWIWNPIDRPGERFILGGGWNDPGYAFVDAYAQPSFDRSSSNGFRCMRELDPEPNLERLTRTIEVPFRDFRSEQPVSDEVFEFFLRQFRYDRRPLDVVQVRDESAPPGRWQTFEIAAAYGGERMQLHLFLPEKGRPPYQTVVLFPGSLALHNRTFGLYEYHRVDFLVRSGRALLLPVYKGTYERGGDVKSDYPETTTFYKDHVVMWGKDLGRAIDFIEMRDDLDADRVAYYGVSWGGAMGAIMPAVEKRIRAVVLYVAGLNFQRALPEADQINYVTRVTQPTLMLNGELDFFFPAETSQKPMFDLLGTSPEHKKRLTYPRGHTVPKREMIKESLAWLKRYLGPTE